MKKKMFLSLLIFAVLPLVLLAGEGGEGGHYLAITGRESDYIPRLVNFAVFAGLLYYLIADPISSFFKSRKEKIADQLKEIENRLEEAKKEHKSAEQALKSSEKKAVEIIKDTEREIEVLAGRYKEMGEREIKILQQQFEEKLAVEERRMQRETILEILDENISTDDIPLSGHKVVDVLSGKAA